MLDKSGARVKRAEGRAGAACVRLLTIIRVGIARIGPLQPWKIREELQIAFIRRDVVEIYARAEAYVFRMRDAPSREEEKKYIAHRGLLSAITS